MKIIAGGKEKRLQERVSLIIMRHLTQNEVAALERLALVSGRRLASRFPGQRPGATAGTSREFMDYRPYHPGDDVRALDWPMYARLRKPFVRLFHAEAAGSVHLLLDISNSMRFGRPDKLTYAKTVVMALSYVGVGNRDRVGLATFSDRLHHVLPPRRGKLQLSAMHSLLKQVEPAGVSDFNRAFTAYSRRARQPGLLLVLSDFFAAAGYEAGLLCLLAHKFEPVVIHILAAEELHPPGAGNVVLRDLEHNTATRLTIHDETLRHYQANMQAFMASLAAFCRRHRVTYVQTLSASSFADLRSRFLQAGVWQRKCTS